MGNKIHNSAFSLNADLLNVKNFCYLPQLNWDLDPTTEQIADKEKMDCLSKS